MSSVRFYFLALTALTAVLLVYPTGLSPVREARTEMAPDAIVRAVAAGNPASLDFALSQGLDVNARDAKGRTPLAVALLKRDRATVERLLKVGGDVDAADQNGRTPLMLAAAQGNVEVLEAVLSRSRLPEATDTQGLSAAHHALAAGQADAFAILLRRLHEVDAPTTDGRDLLEMAFDTGDVGLIKSVLYRLDDNLEWTARTRRVLEEALASNDADLARILLCKHRQAPTANENSVVPLLAESIVKDDAEMFRRLLAAGADPNTTLPKASEPEFVKLIPSEFLRGYVRADENVTVLMLAAGLGKSEYVRALIEAGAERFRQTKRYKMLALYFAARAKQTTTVQILLGKGPSRDALRVEISLATQKASLIKDGVSILQTSVSTGRKGFDTPAGEYVVTDKNKSHVSTLYHVAMPYFMRLNCLDFGMHAGNVPNYPASHGCIRLPADVAAKLFSEVPVGTVVTIN